MKFLMNEIYTSYCSSRHVIHIPSFCIVNLLCCGGHFSNTTLIDAKNVPSMSSGRNFVEWVVHICTYFNHILVRLSQ